MKLIDNIDSVQLDNLIPASIIPEPAVVLPPARRSPNLILHCGAQAATLDEVQSVHTPGFTDTWMPIPHMTLIQTVEKALQANGLTIGNQVHSLSHEGQRYFGLMEISNLSAVSNTCSNSDYCWVLGLRNSHDKTFPAGIVAGATVFVCDNLSFSGEVKFARRHTRFIARDLPQITSRAVGQLMGKWHNQDQRIEAYKQAMLNDRAAHDLVIRATDAGVCSNRLIPTVLHEWREPRHDVFKPRNAWSLFNSFTEALKSGNLAELPKRTEALHGLLDNHVGLGLN